VETIIKGLPLAIQTLLGRLAKAFTGVADAFAIAALAKS
jgi:hypothetical protein